IIYAAESMGIKVDDPDSLKCFIGPPLFSQFKEFFGFGDKQAENAVKKYRKRYSEIGWKECTLTEGTEKLLSDLKEKGYVLALATSKPEVFAVKILDYFDLSQYFDFAGGAQLEHTGRNEKADIIAYVLEKLSVTDRSTVIMVGDRYHDIEGARANGIRSLAVLCGYGSVEEFKEHGADFIAENMEEAGKIIVNCDNLI
ncbi:MAG: HAD hydrolase-like protein, partial [Ruminiclostridium sp.]|nr:HAD hydrolase-like protein [Ruminiclostridium sp.]